MKLGTNIVDSCSKLGRIEGRSQAGDQSKTAVSHRRTHDVRNELRLSQAQAAKMIAHQRLQSRFPYSRTSSRRWREEKPMSGKAFRPSISPTSRTETKSFLFSHTDHLTTHQYALVEDVDGCGSEKKKKGCKRASTRHESNRLKGVATFCSVPLQLIQRRVGWAGPFAAFHKWHACTVAE